MKSTTIVEERSWWFFWNNSKPLILYNHLKKKPGPPSSDGRASAGQSSNLSLTQQQVVEQMDFICTNGKTIRRNLNFLNFLSLSPKNKKRHLLSR